jgi:hypothetical protein
MKKNTSNNNKFTMKRKYSRRKRRYHNKHREHVGGSSFEQKGVAAQLRPSTPHNSALRKKLNEIVHSGDFYESKERNGFLNLDNDFDPEAQIVLNEAVNYIKNNKDLGAKIKKRVLQGIAPVSTSTTTTNSHKTSTKRMRTRTPTKTNRTMTNAIFRNRYRMRTRKTFKK